VTTFAYEEFGPHLDPVDTLPDGTDVDALATRIDRILNEDDSEPVCSAFQSYA
jgi:hypothetical protein